MTEEVSIPLEIWDNKRLPLSAKALWIEIKSWHDDEIIGCYGHDKYLSKKLGIEEHEIVSLLNLLLDEFLLIVFFTGFGKRVLYAVSGENEYNKIISENKKKPSRKDTAKVI